MNVFLATASLFDTSADGLIAAWTTAADRAHAARFRPEERRRASLLGRALMREMLSEICNLGATNLLAGTEGKPFVGGEEGGSPGVSLSHSGAWVAAACADAPVLGMDLERHRRRDYLALADHAFGPRECASLRVAAAADRGAAFFRCWTVREALAKATGRGLAEAIDRRDRVGEGPFEGSWSSEQPDGLWQLAHRQPWPGCSLAVAAPGHDPLHLVFRRMAEMV